MTRELDAEVAEKVMGWRDLGDDERATSGVCPTAKKGDLYPTPIGDGVNRYVPNWSEEIGLAWDVVEKMAEKGYSLTLMYLLRLRWTASFYKANEDHGTEDDASAPTAICRAALSALASKKGDAQ